MTFHDEFDGTQLDPAKWDDHYWSGRTHSNNELEYYAPDGYKVAAGRLRLKGERRPMAGHDYTSGMISSFGHFAQQYGYFEIRAKFPRGRDSGRRSGCCRRTKRGRRRSTCSKSSATSRTKFT